MSEQRREVQEADEKTAPFSFSIRLTKKQRELLTRAAETKNWSDTALLKYAALEKAAFIVNTKSRNRVDFRGLAQAVAEQVFTERTVLVPDEATSSLVGRPMFMEARVVADLPEDAADPPNSETPVASVSPWHKPPTFLDELRDAAHFGGTEFLEQVIQASADIVCRSDSKLQSPVDPITGE